MNKWLLTFSTLIALQSWGYSGKDSTQAAADQKPVELEGVGVTEHLGEKIDLNLTFTNEDGQLVPLSTYFHKDRPVFMAMIYYSCPHLCNFQLNGIVEVLKEMKGRPGIDYDLVAVSMDHTETPEVAKAKKATYVKALGQIEANEGWQFLVGSEANVAALAKQLGFSFKWDDKTKEYNHAAASYILTPDGVLSRYLYGIAFSAQTLRLSFVEASQGKIGSFVEQLTLFCFQFDPHKNQYTFYAYNLMRIGAGLTVLVLVLILGPLWWREKKRQVT